MYFHWWNSFSILSHNLPPSHYKQDPLINLAELWLRCKLRDRIPAKSAFFGTIWRFWSREMGCNAKTNGTNGYCKICPVSTGVRLCCRVYMSYCASLDVNRRKLLYTPVWTMHIVNNWLWQIGNYTVNHKKRWQYVCNHNSGKLWWILITFTYLETGINTLWK